MIQKPSGEGLRLLQPSSQACSSLNPWLSQLMQFIETDCLLNNSPSCALLAWWE